MHSLYVVQIPSLVSANVNILKDPISFPTEFEFLKIQIDRNEGLKVVEVTGFENVDLQQVLVKYLPNGDPPIGSLKLTFHQAHFYCAFIVPLHESKGCYLYKIPADSVENISLLFEGLFQIDICNLPSWKYNIEYLVGLRFLLYSILTSKKVVILGGKVETALFIISIYKLFKIFPWIKLEGIIHSESLAGVEELHGIEFPHKYRWELQNYSSELCFVDLKSGRCWGSYESNLLSEIERLFRQNKGNEARVVLKKISAYLLGEDVDLKIKRDDEILLSQVLNSLYSKRN